MTETARAPTEFDDANKGLSYLNNRHYDPTTGVFASVDPLVSMTMQPDIYGAANPVTFSDPSGLEVCGVLENSEYHCWDDYTGPSDSECMRHCLDTPLPPTDSCQSAPQVCGPQPGSSGLGVHVELELLDEVGRLPADEFCDLALDPDEIERRGLDFLDWSNDGCSNSPDAIGGTSLASAVEVDVGDSEVCEFASADAGGVEDFEHRVVALAEDRGGVGLFEYEFGFVCGEEVSWELIGGFREFDVDCRVPGRSVRFDGARRGVLERR